MTFIQKVVFASTSALIIGCSGCSGTLKMAPATAAPTPAVTTNKTPVTLTSFGDSVCVGVGSTDATHSFISLISNHLGGTLHNFCVSGTRLTEETAALFGNDVPAASESVTVEEGGINDAWRNPASYNYDSQRALTTILVWRSTDNIVLPDNDGKGTITAYGSFTAICPSWKAADGDTTSSLFLVDGTSVATLSGTGVVPGEASVFTQCFYVSPGVHNFQISQGVTVVGVLSAPNPAEHFGAEVFSMGVLPEKDGNFSTATDALNTMKSEVVASLLSLGFNVHFVDVRNTPHVFDAQNFISDNGSYTDGVSGEVCSGTTVDTVHPNNCGHYAEYMSLKTEIDSVIQ